MKRILAFRGYQYAKPAENMSGGAGIIHCLCKGLGPRKTVACFLLFTITLGLSGQYAFGADANNRLPFASLEEIRKLANGGSAEAQHKLGRMYEEGLVGATEDYREAAKWYLKAAENGHAQAQYIMGIMYTLGKGVYKDPLEAAKWFGKAAQRGYEPVKQHIQESGTKLKQQFLKDPRGMIQRNLGG